MATRVGIRCGDDASADVRALNAAAEDVVISMAVDGLDPEIAQRLIDDQADPNKRLSDIIKENFEAHALDLPDRHQGDQVDFDGRLAVTGNVLYAIIPADEIPEGDVHTQWAWWTGFVAGVIGGLVAVAVGALCLGITAVTMPAAAPVCPPVAAFVGGFVTELVKKPLNGEPIDTHTWVDALWAGLTAAMYAALGEAVAFKWASESMGPLLEKIARAVADFGKSIGNWGGQKAVTAVEFVAGIIRRLRDTVDAKLAEWMDRRHWDVDVPRPALRVMPLGDSITYGTASSTGAGYRSKLWGYLVDGEREVDFVGSRQAGTLPDPDNEGHPGRRIDEIADLAYCPVQKYRPNVVTLHAGTNDMNQEFELATAPDRLGALIDQTLKDAPEATVLVATLVPATKEGMQPLIDAYNARIPGIVKQRQDQGKHVRLVDMGEVTTADLAQPAHPNDNGYRKMADAFYWGILESESAGWIKDPVAGSDKLCGTDDDGSAAGPGWRSLGVIATGMGALPVGRVVMAELNGDERADYVKIFDDGTARVALNTPGEPGKPDWVDAGVIQLPGHSPGLGAGVRFADVNGDGRDDYLLLGPEGQVEAYLNKADFPYWDYQGVIAPGVSGATGAAIRFADVNGDGRDDYLRTSDAAAVHAYINTVGDNGKIHWKEWLNWAPGVWYGSRDKLRLADVNGDRKADYLMVGATGAVHAYINDGGGGNGGFTERLNFVFETGYPGPKSTFADISGDGKADYLVIYDGGSVRAWLNRGGNTGA